MLRFLLPVPDKLWTENPFNTRAFKQTTVDAWRLKRPVELRPPPEPPPQFKGKARMGSLIPSTGSIIRYITLSAALGFAVPFRPPRKPPWIRLGVFGCSVYGQYCSGDPLVFRFYPLCFSNFWSQFAYSMFAESPYRTPGCLNNWLWSWLLCVYVLIKCSVWPHLSWIRSALMDVIDMDISPLVVSSSKYKYYAGTMGIISTFNFPSYRQDSLGISMRLDHRETTHSRNVLISAKEMIRNWIDSKTVASPSIMAIYQGRELFDWLIGLFLCSVVEPLWFVEYLVFDPNVVYGLNSRCNSCLGYAPPLVNHPECTVFSQLMK